MHFFLIAITLASALAAAGAADKFDLMSFCYTVPNTEAALASRSASVSYPGIAHATDNNEVKIKIFKGEHDEVHAFEIPNEDKTKSKIYRFVFDNPDDGQYSAQLCFTDNGGTTLCSHRSAPTTPIDTGKTDTGKYHELTCERTNADNSKISLSTELKSVSGYASDADMKLLKGNTRSVLMKNGFSNNKEVKYIGGKKMAYFAVTYPARYFREWAKKNDKCKRKYFPILLTYVIDKTTKRILARDRLSPYMPKSMYPKFLGLQKELGANGEYENDSTYQNIDSLPDAPIEMLVNVDELVEEKMYTVWHTACMVRNEGMDEGITRCAEPFTGDFDYQGVVA